MCPSTNTGFVSLDGASSTPSTNHSPHITPEILEQLIELHGTIADLNVDASTRDMLSQITHARPGDGNEGFCLHFQSTQDYLAHGRYLNERLSRLLFNMTKSRAYHGTICLPDDRNLFATRIVSALEGSNIFLNERTVEIWIKEAEYLKKKDLNRSERMYNNRLYETINPVQGIFQEGWSFEKATERGPVALDDGNTVAPHEVEPEPKFMPQFEGVYEKDAIGEWVKKLSLD